RSRQRRMRLIRRRNPNQSNRRNRKQLIQCSHNFRAWINLRGLISFSLQNSGQPQARHTRKKRRVKRFPSQSKSDQSAINHFCPSSTFVSSFAYQNWLRQNAMMSSKTQTQPGAQTSSRTLIFSLLCLSFVLNGLIITFIGTL